VRGGTAVHHPGGRPERRYRPGREEGRARATNPDPTAKLATSRGVTLDDGATMCHLRLAALPGRPDGAAWVPVAELIFATPGDADRHGAFVVPAGESVARRSVGDAEQRVITFVDPDLALVPSLGLVPARVRAPAPRHDGRRVERGIGPARRAAGRSGSRRGQGLTCPEEAGSGDPRPTPGWPISAA